MKPLYLTILIITSLLGCREKKEEDRRYFYVGYNVINEDQKATGSFTFESDSLPSIEYFKDIVFGLFGCYGYKREEVYIQSLHEFKDSLEYKTWRKPNGGSVFDSCVNINNTPTLQDVLSYGQPENFGRLIYNADSITISCDIFKQKAYAMFRDYENHIDLLQKELNNIKAKQAEYRYADYFRKAKGEALGGTH